MANETFTAQNLLTILSKLSEEDLAKKVLMAPLEARASWTVDGYSNDGPWFTLYSDD